jgi:hypothetical protein
MKISAFSVLFLLFVLSIEMLTCAASNAIATATTTTSNNNSNNNKALPDHPTSEQIQDFQAVVRALAQDQVKTFHRKAAVEAVDPLDDEDSFEDLNMEEVGPDGSAPVQTIKKNRSLHGGGSTSCIPPNNGNIYEKFSVIGSYFLGIESTVDGPLEDLLTLLGKIRILVQNTIDSLDFTGGDLDFSMPLVPPLGGGGGATGGTDPATQGRRRLGNRRNKDRRRRRTKHQQPLLVASTMVDKAPPGAGVGAAHEQA